MNNNNKNNNNNNVINSLINNLNNLNINQLKDQYQQLELVNKELNERIKSLEQQHSNEIKLKDKQLFNLQSQVDFYKQQYDQLNKIEYVVLSDDDDDNNDNDISNSNIPATTTTTTTTNTVHTQEGKLKQNVVYNKELDYYEIVKVDQEIIELNDNSYNEQVPSIQVKQEPSNSIKQEPTYNIKQESNYSIKKEL